MIIPKHVFLQRNAIIDVLRATAILLVLFFHFNKLLEIGFIGVDLFFVLSGYLVSKFYLNSKKSDESNSWRVFLIKRFTKILPSYYFFLLAGSLFAYLFFLPNHASQVIPLSDYPKYIFFYLNYDLSYQWSFELAWSLCVEEHFYLFLSLFFVFIGIRLIKQGNPILKYLLISFIIVSFIFKCYGYYRGWDTLASTHMRMDALFLGVLLSYQEEIEFKMKEVSWPYTILGVLIIVAVIVKFYIFPSVIFSAVFLHTLTPISFYFIIRGLVPFIPRDTLLLKTLRVFAYYSYNWYLWHAIVAYTFINFTNLPTAVKFILYFLVSLLMAIITTKLIEENFLKLRIFLIGLFKV